MTYGLSIKEMALDERPREKLKLRGPAALTNGDLIAIILNTGIVGETVTAVAQRLLVEHDGLLIASPEYNSSITGVLKNAIDWASRPPLAPVLAGKPVALLGASTGMGGTANAQRQVREALGFPRARVLEEPKVLVASSYEKFEDGRLVDEETRAQIADLVETLMLAAGLEAPARAA